MRVGLRSVVATTLALLTAFAMSCATDDSEFLDPGSANLGVGTVTGTVTFNGAPLEGVVINTTPFASTAFTDPLGRFTMPGLIPQTLIISASKTGFTTAFDTVTIIAGRTVTLDISIIPSSTLGGLSGTITDGDLPLERVSVTTIPPTLNIVTTGDGRYDMPLVQAGTYRVDAFRVGFMPGRVYLVAEPGETVVGDIAMARRTDGIIFGQVLDAAANPIANASVTIFYDSDAQSTVTGSDGSFTFHDLTTGYYVISATALGYYPGSRSIEAWGGIPVNGDVVLSLQGTVPPLPGSIAGTVWDSSYLPLAGALVTLDPAGPTPVTTVTGSDGRYVIPSVAMGIYDISAGMTDYVTSTRSIEVGPTITADGWFVLKRDL